MAIAPQAAPRTGVPFFDLRPSSAAFRDALLDDIAALLDSGAFTNGPAVREFEVAFSEYCRNRSLRGVASGLDALRLALLAGGLEPGDEVIVPAATFAATFEAVTQAGGVPVVADVPTTTTASTPRPRARRSRRGRDSCSRSTSTGRWRT